MNHIDKDLLMDCSTAESFCFSLRCANCGETWRSKPIRFSRAGIEPKTQGKSVVFEALYKREKELALEAAVKQAEQSFSMCPICRRLVCDKCFMVCDDLDMCVNCARALHEKGETVI